MTAFVRVCGPPNSNFLVGYPGISATLVCSQTFYMIAKRGGICLSGGDEAFADPTLTILHNNSHE